MLEYGNVSFSGSPARAFEIKGKFAAIGICNLIKQAKRFKCERGKKVTKYKYTHMHLKELRIGKLLGRRHLKLKKFCDGVLS